MMPYVAKIKKLIKTGDPTHINQALQIADSLFDKGSKEMKEIVEFLGDFLEDKSDLILDNNRGERVTHITNTKPPIQLSVPVWTEVSLVYRDGEILAEVSLVEDWDTDIEITNLGVRYGFIKVTRDYERIVEKELRVLPVSHKIVVDGFDSLELDEAASSIRYSLIKKLEKPVQRAADKIEKMLNR